MLSYFRMCLAAGLGVLLCGVSAQAGGRARLSPLHGAAELNRKILLHESAQSTQAARGWREIAPQLLAISVPREGAVLIKITHYRPREWPAFITDSSGTRSDPQDFALLRGFVAKRSGPSGKADQNLPVSGFLIPDQALELGFPGRQRGARGAAAIRESHQAQPRGCARD
jgi:hypothetical protein